MVYSVKPSITKEELEQRLAALASMSPSELRREWARVWGTVCYSHNYALLRRRIAWRLRCLCHGGLAPSAIRKAQELADLTQLRERAPSPHGRRSSSGSPCPGATCAETVSSSVPPSVAPTPSDHLRIPGSYACKSFNGRSYTVYALESGRFSLDGATFPTLTAVARHIAGYRVSGNRFFASSTTFSH